MCDVIIFGEDEFSLRDTITPSRNRKVLVSDGTMTTSGVEVSKPMYWDGWARDDAVHDWTKSGKWKMAEILATGFGITTRRGRMKYELPPFHTIKAIALDSGDRIVIRVLSREPQGLEAEVCARFAKTGPQRVLQARR